MNETSTPVSPLGEEKVEKVKEGANHDDSSDDDSSYFADPNNLPSPKSGGRRFSWSSSHSLNRIQSDASLSLSDSEEEKAPDLQAQHRITRLHSVSSLMSTETHSDEEDVPVNPKRPPLNNTGEHHSLVYSEDGEHIHLTASNHSSQQKLPPTIVSNDREKEESPYMERSLRGKEGFKVYWQRWIMLMYMSILNLLSDWTCYSVAPIALLTEEAFGNINPEQLVVVFLGANAVATACEPIILSRLGLRKTVVLGGLLLMIGSIVKSGGMPPIIAAGLEKGKGEWRVYLGFFLVGLSQPLYQCTPALLSASWFPDHERTMATGVALNANQIGIGFAFIFGTLLVKNSDDIPDYFGLLSIISTITFLGTLIQFDDAPPSPPSDTARVMRGDLAINIPNTVRSIVDSVRNLGASLSNLDQEETKPSTESKRDKKSSRRSKNKRSSGKAKASAKSGNNSTGSGSDFHGLAPAPSPATYGSVMETKRKTEALSIFPAPSPMMPGAVGSANEADQSATPAEDSESNTQTNEFQNADDLYAHMAYGMPAQPIQYGYPMPPIMPSLPTVNEGAPPQAYGAAYYPYPYPPMYQYGYPQEPQFWQGHQGYSQHPNMYAPPPQYYYGGYQYPPMAYDHQQQPESMLPAVADIDDGAEPVLTMTPHHLDINIRDDQILLSTRACLTRPGFIHSLVSFTVSGIVINTLSTFMDYLVRLNGAGREYTGIVGGSFQFGIMISSLIIGKITDSSRAYYSITIGMLVLGAFGLAQCGVSLDADRGEDLRFSLIVVALLVGPLQPVSTELGVDVVYPLSENTVLVIQQLFSNLLSALFIPCFKAMKDVGRDDTDDSSSERPEYTFSFYLLIVLHAAATVFFATFNGRYLRYEHELAKKEAEKVEEDTEETQMAHPQFWSYENQPLMHHALV